MTVKDDSPEWVSQSGCLPDKSWPIRKKDRFLQNSNRQSSLYVKTS